MKSIYINRNITLQRAGHDDVALPKGNHTVADDVAEHPFVKHHTSSVTDAPDGVADLQALLDQTRIAAASEIEQLKEQLVAAQDDAAAAPELRLTIVKQQTALSAALQRAEAAEKSRADAVSVIAERDATIAAYAAMTPAADTKAKK